LAGPAQQADDMTDEDPLVDRGDPAVRAALRLEGTKARDRGTRIGAAVTLGALAVVGPLVAKPLTGDPGATVGAVLVSLLVVALAVAVWPQSWSAEERRHHELEAIWREARSDADASVAWRRFAVWAREDRGAVELILVRCAPSTARAAGAPSPYDLEVASRFAPEEVAAAAEAMEKLRADAADRELHARQEFEQTQVEAEQAAHVRTLREIDESAEAELRAREVQMRREIAEQEAADAQSQAEAVARALRRP
jgi:hypothetical protein